MAITIQKNYSDTPISGVTALNLSRGLVNFKADFAVKSDEPGEAIITNRKSPLDAPETFRFGMTSIKDVYVNRNIDPGTYSPSKRGTQVLAQLEEVWTKTNSDDTSYRVNMPVSAHIVIRTPNDSAISLNDITELVGRLVSGLFETGSLTTDRLASLYRGSMLPSDL